MKLSIGDHVVDHHGHEGIVVRFVQGFDDTDHGQVYVWQLDRTEYGADNCEHYTYMGWERLLKILKKAGDK